MGLLYFVDKYGRLSLKEARWFEEEEGSNSYGSTSFGNTPSPQSVPSLGRSTSGSSSIYPATGSPNSIEVPLPGRTAEPSVESAGPGDAQRGLIPENPGKPGGPPPPDGRFFNDPRSLRTILTGTEDGYRSPEPPSRLDTLSPLRHVHLERPMFSGGPTGMNQALMERLRPSPSVTQPVAAQPPGGPGPGIEHGCGPPPPSSNSSVLPAELMFYNDLVMDIGIAQYLGSEVRERAPPPPINLSMSRGDDGSGSYANGYQWQGVSHHASQEPPQATSFGCPQPGWPSCGTNDISAQQPHASFDGQWLSGGITDFR